MVIPDHPQKLSLLHYSLLSGPTPSADRLIGCSAVSLTSRAQRRSGDRVPDATMMLPCPSPFLGPCAWPATAGQRRVPPKSQPVGNLPLKNDRKGCWGPCSLHTVDFERLGCSRLLATSAPFFQNNEPFDPYTIVNLNPKIAEAEIPAAS